MAEQVDEIRGEAAKERQAWLAEREEELWRRLGDGVEIFDDQYLSSGGQIYVSGSATSTRLR